MFSAPSSLSVFRAHGTVVGSGLQSQSITFDLDLERRRWPTVAIECIICTTGSQVHSVNYSVVHNTCVAPFIHELFTRVSLFSETD